MAHTLEHDHEVEEMSLKVSVKDGKTCEKILKVEIGQEEIQKEYDHFYRGIANKSKVPGFRPGKAPRNVLELHYSNEARQHVVEHLISHSYQQAVKEKGLDPLSFPDVKDVKFDDKKLSYEALVEIRPKVKLSKTAGLSVKKEKIEFKSEEIDQVLKRIQDSLAQYKAIEDRAAKMGDVVIADYTCIVDGKEVEKRPDDWFEIQEKDYLEGFSKQLIGVKPGDERNVETKFPAEFSKKELAGKQAMFNVKVKELKLKSLPELNDELAQSAGEFKTLAELKEHIEKDIRSHKERENEAKYEKDLLDEFVKQNKIDIPEGLVKRRAEKLMENATREFQARGGVQGKFEEFREKMRPDFEKEARRQIHLAFLLDEVANKENIQVTEEELKERYQTISSEVRQPAEVVEKYYADNEDAREALRDQVRSEKAIQFLKDNVKANA